ncbi:F-box/kelch-repeat protein At3g06240-like [Argentina anserina]|uniref:F-box/kelch-repeat protein At3g06240-like n=1 Tax=Argentina anserina TaxID=57926 RepID=UPI002176211E|nr:F-box/kelch-repeat protein At3g06240-like [Potentilla anserina]
MSDYLQEPIIEKILLSLPPRSLIKCTTVCKSWLALIKSSTFIQTHLRHTIQDNNSRLLLLKVVSKSEESSKSYSLLWRDPVSGECNLMDPITFIIDYERNISAQSLSVIGTYNGLVCLGPRVVDDFPVLFWNLSIRSILILPTSPTPYSIFKRYAFGYDSRTNDYKVLLIRFVTPPLFDCTDFVNVNGCPHWSGNQVGDNSIMSFDMVSEVFIKIQVPEALGARQAGVQNMGTVLPWLQRKYHLTSTFGTGRVGNFEISSGMCCYFMDSIVESILLPDHANVISFRIQSSDHE